MMLLENTEVLRNPILRGIPSFFTHHENDGISRSIGFHTTSVFSRRGKVWEQFWKINDMLLYKAIIDFHESVL